MVAKKPMLNSLPKTRPDMPKAIQKLGAEWFVGMFESKGTFGATVTSRGSKVSSVTPHLRLFCDAKDLSLLYRFQEILGCGHINAHKTYQGSPAKCVPVNSRYVFRVTNVKDLVTKVLPFFERHELAFVQQARTFHIFRELCVRVQNKEHWSKKGLVLIKERICELKACRYRFASEATPGSVLNHKELSLDRLLGIFAVNGFFRAHLLTNKTGKSKNTKKTFGVELSVWVVCNEKNQKVLHQFQERWGLRDSQSSTIKKLAERQIDLPQESSPSSQTSVVLTVKDPVDVKKVIAFFKGHGLVTDVQRMDFDTFCRLADLFLTNQDPVQMHKAIEGEDWMSLLSQMKGYSKFFRKFAA